MTVADLIDAYERVSAENTFGPTVPRERYRELADFRRRLQEAQEALCAALGKHGTPAVHRGRRYKATWVTRRWYLSVEAAGVPADTLAA